MCCYSKRGGTLDFLSLENYSGPSRHPLQGPPANSSENVTHLNMSKKRNDQSFCSINYEEKGKKEKHNLLTDDDTTEVYCQKRVKL